MMRRPLLFAAVSFSVAVLAAYYIGIAAACGAGCAAALAAVYMKAGKLKRIAAVIAVSYAVSLSGYIFYHAFPSPFSGHTGSEAYVGGRVVSVQEKEDSRGEEYVRLTLVPYEIEGSYCREGISGIISSERNRLLVNIYDEDAEDVLPGAYAGVSGEIEEPDGARNPGCFDYGLYLKSVGTDRIMYAEGFELIDDSGSFSGRLYAVKSDFIDRMRENIGDEAAGLMRGIMFGEKDDISDEVMEEFQRNGTAHILAVSGLHIAMIYGAIAKVWVWRKGKLYFAAVTVFLISYCVLASFSPSVVRAVFMVEMHLAAKLMDRRYDLSSAAFLVYMLMLLKNPMQIFNAGLQMSFIAVLTLSLLLPYIKSFYSGMFAAGIAVQAGLLPYTMQVFNYFSLASVFVNVPVIFLTGILTPLCLLSFVLSLFSGMLSDLAAIPLYGVSRLLLEINSMTCIEGVTSFDVKSPGHAAVALFYLALLVFVSEEGRLAVIRRKKRLIAVMAVSCIAASLIFGAVTKSGFEDKDLVFVDVGQGDCIHFRTEDGGSYLIDGGGKEGYDTGRELLKPYLLKNGTSEIDGAFVTHLHTDHYKGVAELCREGMVKRLFVYEGCRSLEGKIIEETGLAPEKITYLEMGDTIELCGSASVEVLWPEGMDAMPEDADENETSLILRLELNGISVLATGDVDAGCHEELVKIYGRRLETDIVKVAHHGSRYSLSEDFIENASPSYAVFQVGENTYGHPADSVIEAHEEAGAVIYRNDEDGAVGFDTKAMHKEGGEGIVCMVYTGDHL